MNILNFQNDIKNTQRQDYNKKNIFLLVIYIYLE